MNGVEMKMVMGLLGARARERLCGGRDHWIDGYGSSGSEHEADSECLAELIHGFMEEDDDLGEELKDAGENEEIASDAELSEAEMTEALEELSRRIDDFDNPTRSAILRVVLEATDGAEGPRSEVRRSVMMRLREAGFNAGVCKTKWETSGGLTLGSYEYIDVIVSGKRHIVDIDFASEFEIARPTERYSFLLASMPRVLVCRPDNLRRVIRIAAEAAKRSMKSQGLHLPPWRKNRYMQAKWFGSYRRTTNPIAASSSSEPSASTRLIVGFDAGVCRRKPALGPALTAIAIAPL